ncbi:MAG: quinone-dependent dihydroorotate dehydrogenase [Geminicoccaceae bacterium]|nr:MAG: quinone-dependent dihydroorotate dehydrogenase [Geminicoccaceae bacterium]
MQLTAFLTDRLGLDRAAVGALRTLDAETAHGLALGLLRRLPAPGPMATPTLGRRVAGLDFPNPLGVAAGFDKNGEVFDRLLDWGFGFVEVGTTTPRPQAGNPKPRLFRLVEDRAVINRMGLNNQGHAALAKRLERRDRRRGIVGVNIGYNKDSDDPIADYVRGVDVFAELADYLTVNVSSPNTPGLRALQHGAALRGLLDAVLEARSKVRHVPIFLKLAPDLRADEVEALLAIVNTSAVDGLIVSNTTVERPATLQGRHKLEGGGLSGRPLFEPSTALLRRVRAGLDDTKAVIGVGGIEDALTAKAKLAAGAGLLQLYTGLVYGGLALGRRILAQLASEADLT